MNELSLFGFGGCFDPLFAGKGEAFLLGKMDFSVHFFSARASFDQKRIELEPSSTLTYLANGFVGPRSLRHAVRRHRPVGEHGRGV